MTNHTMRQLYHTMTPLCEPKATVEKPGELSPFVVEFFMVQGAGFRCMAYRDSDGRWRAAFNNDELFGDIYILE